MKKVLSVLLCTALIALSLLSLCACSKMELNGVFTTEDGENQRIYTFYTNVRSAETEADGSRPVFNRLIVTEVIDEVSFDTYFKFEIREENGEEFLELEYEGIVYEGNDIYVAHMANALDINHKKNPHSSKPLNRTSDFIEIDGLKLVSA